MFSCLQIILHLEICLKALRTPRDADIELAGISLQDLEVNNGTTETPLEFTVQDTHEDAVEFQNFVNNYTEFKVLKFFRPNIIFAIFFFGYLHYFSHKEQQQSRLEARHEIQ
jgi:hypothetical protein